MFFITVVLPVSENEGNTAILHCGRLTKGKVTWSRDVNGQRVDILTTHNGETTKHITDLDRRYSSGSYLSLIIYGVSRSHAGKYYCNGATVELTVRSVLWIPYSVRPTTEMRSDDPLTTESSLLDIEPSTTTTACPPTKRRSDEPLSTESSLLHTESTTISTESSLLHTEPITSTTDGMSVNVVETVLMFGGVGLAALMFLLATVAAGRVILHQNRQTG
ncbi:hypothetical protein SRHO_G00098350 [Serrasalmus rhombeus]